jgi:crossover junction endodeoxyribonuclease RusA
VDIRELVIPGTPVSLQASARSRERWKARVRAVAEVVVPEEDQLNGLLYRDLRVWVVYFHLGEMDGDLDNIAKPLLDGLTGAVWSNDRQIARLTLRRGRRDADPAVLYELVRGRSDSDRRRAQQPPREYRVRFRPRCPIRP